MGNAAGAAVLDALPGLPGVPPAALTQHIQRAIAEKTVEIPALSRGMTGKIGAGLVSKIPVARLLTHTAFPPFGLFAGAGTRLCP